MKEGLSKSKEINIERRKFLIGSGGAVAGTLLASFVPVSIARAEAHEVKEGDPFKAGLLKLRQEVINNPNEVGIDFRIDKDGKGSWENTSQGGAVGLGGSAREIDFITESVKRKDEEVDSFHTHPLETTKRFGFITGKTLDAIRNGEQIPIPSVPPSNVSDTGEGDLGQALYLEARFGKSIRVRCMVVDAKGIWTYTPDTSYPFTKKYTENLVLLHKTLFSLRENQTVQSLIRTMPLDKRQDIASICYNLWHSFSKELGPEVSATIKNASNAWYELFIEFKKQGNNLNKTIEKFQHSSTKEYSPSFSELSEAYKKLGFIVNFTSFQDLS